MEPECQRIIKQVWRVKETRVGTWQAVSEKLKESEVGQVGWPQANGK
jgi:hypothetical protein